MVSTQTQKPVPAIHQGTRQVVYGDNNYPTNLEDATAIVMSLWYRGTLRSLVEAQPWAQELIESGRAFPVESLDDVVRRVSF